LSWLLTKFHAKEQSETSQRLLYDAVDYIIEETDHHIFEARKKSRWPKANAKRVIELVEAEEFAIKSLSKTRAGQKIQKENKGKNITYSHFKTELHSQLEQLDNTHIVTDMRHLYLKIIYGQISKQKEKGGCGINAAVRLHSAIEASLD
jgi:hypothetical protein